MNNNPFLSSQLKEYLQNFYFPDMIHQKRLIWGESGTGKTLFTTLFLIFLHDYENFTPDQITIADFGPKRILKGENTIGGRLSDFYPKIESNELSIKPPRMTATNSNELIHICCQNFTKTNTILTNFIANPTSVLIINDVSIFLHIGGFRTLLKAINAADTVLINGYGGNILLKDLNSGISTRESRMMKLLRKKLVNRQTDAEFAQIMQNIYHQLHTSNT